MLDQVIDSFAEENGCLIREVPSREENVRSHNVLISKLTLSSVGSWWNELVDRFAEDACVTT